MLTSDQVRFFHETGYVAARGVLDADALAHVRGAVAELLDTARRVTANNDVFILESGHSAERPRLQRVNHPVEQQPVFWELATSDAVLDCVAALIGDDIRYHHCKLNFKAAGGGAAIGWHQDFAFFPHSNYDVLACGIALQDATVENGCLLVVPGSHRGPILNHRDDDGSFAGRITDPPHAFHAESAVPITLAAGDMSIHHACIVHGSTRNDSPADRPLLIYEYAACDAVPLDYRPPANRYSRRVVRGREATHARLVGPVELPLRGAIGAAESIFDYQENDKKGVV